MRLEQLRYIIEIADTGSFTMASERLFIAQPSISQAVTALEKELNVTLFTRYRTGAVPTQVGLQVIAHAREIMRSVGEIEKLSVNDYSKINTIINVGVIPTLSAVVLPHVISSYRSIFPNVAIKTKEEGTQKIVKDCLKGDINLGLIATHGKRIQEPDILYQHLFDGRLMAYVGARSSLASRQKITFRELLPFQLFLYGEEFSLHKYCLEQISQYGQPNVMSTTHNPESIKRFVSQTEAVGFGPDISLMGDIYVKSRTIFPIEITDASEIEFGLVTSKKRKPDVAVDAFIKEILAYLPRQ
ncbi:MAG: LysR family transcriptional regulator [Lachnospiraceae bacterium]|nr:LysR family transcriptional regulator [Lachnospiraceae bacterium]